MIFFSGNRFDENNIQFNNKEHDYQYNGGKQQQSTISIDSNRHRVTLKGSSRCLGVNDTSILT